MKITRFLTAVLFASSATLSAEDGHREYIAAGFNFAHGHAHDMTQKTWGGLNDFSGEFGIQFKHPLSNISIRPNFGMAKMTGDAPTEVNPNIYDLMGIYIGTDLVYTPFSLLPLSITTGPSFHVWNVDKLSPFGSPNQGDKGIKFGWRLGVGYDIDKKYRVELTYTFTEWRTIQSEVSTQYIPGFNPSRPAYFCLKASYSF
jgi:hypothetical protein